MIPRQATSEEDRVQCIGKRSTAV